MRLRKWKSWSPLVALGLFAGGAQGQSPFTWNTTDGNWSLAANWLNAVSAPQVPVGSTTTELIFGASGATSYTSTNDIGAFTLNRMTFNNTGTGLITVTGGTITLGGTTPTINVTAGNVDVGSILAGTAGFTKAGAGTLVLSNVANTYTGVTRVSAGVLSASFLADGGVASSIGAGAVAPANWVIDGGTFRYTGATGSTNRAFTVGAGGGTFDVTDAAANLTFATAASSITGAAAAVLNKVGPGTLTFNGANTGFVGTMNVNAGIFRIEDLGGGGDFNAVLINVNNGGRFEFVGPAGNSDLPAGTVVAVHTGGVVEFSEGEDYGAINLFGGTYNAINASNNLGLTSEFRSGALTVLSGTGNLGGAGALRKTTAGTVVVTGFGLNMTGAISIEEGVLETNASVAGGATGSISFGTAATAGTLRFTGATGVLNKAVTINGGGGTIDISTAAGVVTVSSIISGTGAATKAGPGTLELTGVNSYAGGTTITGGTLRLGSGGATGSVVGPISIASGAILAVNRSDNTTFSNAISGAGNLTKLGTNILTLNGNLSYTGATSVSGGSLRINPFNGGAFTVADAATLEIVNAGTAATQTMTNLNLGAAAASTLAFSLNSGNPAVPLVNVTANNGLILGVPGQVLRVTNAQPFTVGSFTLIDYAGTAITSGFTLDPLPARTLGALVYDTANTRIDLNITGVDSIKWNGNLNTTWETGPAINTGTPLNWLLVSNNSATNFVANDTVRFDDTATAGSFTVNIPADVLPSSVTVANSANAYTFQGAAGIGGTGGLVKSGTNALTILTNNTYAGTTQILAGTVNVGNGGTTGSLGTGDWTVNGNLVLNRSDALAFGGAIAGSGNLTKSGANTLTLTGLFTLGGTVTLSGGGLVLDSASTYTLPAAITGAGALTKSNTGTLILTGDIAPGGGTTISGGILSIGNGGTTGTLANGSSLAVLTTLAFNRSNDSTYAGAITGGGNLEKNGAGRLTITGDATYSGSTLVNGGILQFNNTAAMTGFVGPVGINTGATLQFNNANVFTLAGVVGGTGEIVKNLGGDLVLNNNNNPFTGTVTINGGRVLLEDNGGTGGDLGASLIVVNAGGIFQFGDTGGNPDLPTTTYVTINTGGEVIWRIGEQFGGVNLQGGLLTLNGGNAGGTDGAVPQAWTSGTVNGITANNIGGTAAINKTTSGTVTVTGLAGVTSALNIQDGRVIWSTSSNVGSGALSFGTTAPTTGTLEYQGATAVTRAGAVALTGPGIIRVTDAAGALTMSGVFSGAGSLTKEGAGTLLLSGANTYTGGTTISAGTLQVGIGTTVGVLPGNVTNNAALVFNRTNALTVGGDIGGTGSLTLAGTGTLTLTGNNTYSGGTTVSAGILQANNTVGSATGTGNVTIATGATLQGTGFIVPSAGNKVVINGGRLKGGASPGTLTIGDAVGVSGVVDINASSTFVIDLRTTGGFTAGGPDNGASGIGGADNSRVTVLGAAGQLNFNAIGSLTVKVNGDAALFSPSSSYSFLVGGAASVNPFTGLSGTIAVPGQFDFSGLTNSATLAGSTFSFTSVANNVYLNIVTPVPEPTCMLLAGAVGLAWNRRRKGKGTA